MSWTNDHGVPTPVVGVPDAAAHFDWLAYFSGEDAPASSASTRQLLGWRPTRPTLLADLEAGHYFD